MQEGLVESAAHLPAPLFVVAVSLLVFVSVAGLPVPIPATLLIAGALSTQMPNGVLVFLALMAALTISTSARDVIVLLIGQHGLGRLWRWFGVLRVRPGKAATTSSTTPLTI